MSCVNISLAWLVLFVAASTATRIVCYYGGWSINNKDEAKFTLPDINPELCTHLTYAFIGLNEDASIKVLYPETQTASNSKLSGYIGFNNLKFKNTNVRTLVSIGGWDEGSVVFSNVVSDPEKRSKFVKNSRQFLQVYNFDGLDVAWKYPAQRGGADSDKENYIELLKNLREEFDKFGFTLSAIVGGPSYMAKQSYILPEILQYVHFLNLWTFDMHGHWEPQVDHHSPLFPSPDKQEQDPNCVKSVLDYWLNNTSDPEKLNLAVTGIGRAFKLADSGQTSIGSPANGAGGVSEYGGGSGSMTYYEICSRLPKGWHRVWDSDRQVPYAFSSTDWVGFDDPQSIKLKVEYAKQRQLGGIAFWRMDVDDFKGTCGKKNPLLQAINAAFGRFQVDEPQGNKEKECKRRGYLRDPEDCSKFIYCSPDGHGEFTMYTFDCPSGQLYDTTIGSCESAALVTCD